MKEVNTEGIFWNIIGSTFYAISSMLIGVAVSRLQGDFEGGLFFFAFSTLGQQLYIVSNFGQRPIMITDMSHRYSFGDYLGFRRLSFILAIILGLIYSLIFADSLYIGFIWMLMIVYKASDGLADCYESEFQRQLRLDITGKSILLRSLISVAVFLGVLILSKNLILSSLSFLISLLLVIYIVDIQGLKKIKTVDYSFDKLTLKPILDISKWLFLASFLDMYIFSASKYAVSNLLGYEQNAYFSIIFIPTSIINLMANFIIRPMLTKLSLLYKENNMKAFRVLIYKLLLGIAGLTLAAAISGLLFGLDILSFVKGVDMSDYRLSFVILLIGGGVYAVLNLLYYVLVIFESRREIFISYVIVSVIAFFLTEPMVLKLGINGASLSYLIMMLLNTALFAGFVIKSAKN